jgi:hypothetical protein
MGGVLVVAPFAKAQSQSGAGQQSQTQTEGQTGHHGQMSGSQSQTGAQQQQYETMEMSVGETPRTKQSRAAAKMLEHTAQARQSIKNKNRQQAMTHVNQALESAGKIQTTARVVPIFTEFEETSVIGPIQAARAETQPATEAAREAEPEQPAAGAAGRGTAVREVEGGFTSIAVDMSEARTHLDAAKTALQSGDMAQADRSLLAVQNSVDMVSVESDMPLVKARQNLALALNQAKQGQMSNAQAPLTEAANALNEYRQLPGAEHSSEAAQLSKDIQNFMSVMDQKSQTQASEQIQQWWNRVADWTGREGGQQQR